jgi:predicted GIY-YIG superfamily endonuclease
LELQRRYTEGRSPSKLEIYKQLNSKEKAEDKMYATKNLAKNFSNPLLGTKKVENEKNHDYFKLQDKLSSIETRIEEMRRQVIGKREEK